MAKRLLLLFLYSFFFVFGCTREIAVQLPGPVVEEGQITGNVILPAGTKADTTGLVVLSATGSSIPVASRYAIDTSGNVSTTVLNNGKGDVLLLGYNYPGQTDHSISSESTALALLMNTLTLRSLTVAGKLETIEKIKKEPTFKVFAEQIELGLQQGRAVTDTTNAGLIRAMADVFKSATGLRTAKNTGYSDPIRITTSNTEVLLQNNRVAHAYVAGVYKEGKSVGPKYVIGGAPRFATSVADAMNGFFGDGYGTPQPAQFTLSGNGEYTIRIRSGRPMSGDGDIESTMAQRENIYNFFMGMLVDFLPLRGCAPSVLGAIPQIIKGSLDKKETILATANSPEVFAALSLEIAAEAIEKSNDLLKTCEVEESTIQFLKRIGQAYTFIGYACKFWKVGNVIAHTNDLFQAKAAIDTCFQVVGLKLVKCGEQPVYKTEIVSGNDQKAEEGKALPEPLVVKVTMEDGKPAIKTGVNWVIKAGGGKVSSGETETSYDGIAKVNWTVGKGEQQLEAFVNKAKGSTSAVFNASTFTNDRKVEIFSGNKQTGQYNKELSSQLTIRVINAVGEPEFGVGVTWKILTGGGDFANLQYITNAQGLASTSWKLGASGAQSVEVTVNKKNGTPAEGSPVIFTAVVPVACDARDFIGTYTVEMLNTCYPNPDGTPALYTTNTLKLFEGGRSLLINSDGSEVEGKYRMDGCRFIYNNIGWCNDPQGYLPASPNYQRLHSCGCLSLKHTKQ